MHEDNDVAENSAAEGVLCWTWGNRVVNGVVNAPNKFCFLSFHTKRRVRAICWYRCRCG